MQILVGAFMIFAAMFVTICSIVFATRQAVKENRLSFNMFILFIVSAVLWSTVYYYTLEVIFPEDKTVYGTEQRNQSVNNYLLSSHVINRNL